MITSEFFFLEEATKLSLLIGDKIVAFQDAHACKQGMSHWDDKYTKFMLTRLTMFMQTRLTCMYVRPRYQASEANAIDRMHHTKEARLTIQFWQFQP